MNIDPVDIVQIVGYVGMAVAWLYQRRKDHEANTRARAEAIAQERRESEERATIRDSERLRLQKEMEERLFARLREQLESLEADNKELRLQVRELSDELAKTQREYNQLLIFGRPEDQKRIRELEARVAHLEAEKGQGE